MSEYSQTLRQQWEPWFAYCAGAWAAAGEPVSLSPGDVLDHPIRYNLETYIWLDRRYSDSFRKVYDLIDPDALSASGQDDQFVKEWRRHYEPITIWKQIAPLFVVGDALGSIDERHVRLAVAYAIGKAIPSVATDHLLDMAASVEELDFNLLLFCLRSTLKGAELVHQIAQRGLDAIVDSYLDHVQQMYELMWREMVDRYQLPNTVNQQTLRNYLESENRLLSSVFFGSTITWAFQLHTVAGLPKGLDSALRHLRRARQLVDELLDYEADIDIGLVTFPYLHGLADSGSSHALRRNIRATWDESVDRDIAEDLRSRRNNLLKDSKSLEATAIAAVAALEGFADFVVDYFSVAQAFEVTLLVNQRLSAVVRVAENEWNEISDGHHWNDPSTFADSFAGWS